MAKSIHAKFATHAEYYIKTGRGRQISKEEAIEVLNKVEEAGLVHTVFATEGYDTSSYICNCCGCSCSGFRLMRQFGGGAISQSNFRAAIDAEKCVACGACVDVCPQNAIKLGNGLCGSVEKQIDRYDTYYDTPWGKDKHNNNYRARTMVTNSGTAPCKTKCPAHISVQGYIEKAAQGKYQEALELIKKDNPFPAVCGRSVPIPVKTSVPGEPLTNLWRLTPSNCLLPIRSATLMSALFRKFCISTIPKKKPAKRLLSSVLARRGCPAPIIWRLKDIRLPSLKSRRHWAGC
ncbi:DUF362 domain-containing protein [Acetobacterium wieringae]|uniref:DUF362 domain-containing protein n=1 Tax=Acetobacterium wieringae TaxID=52694 RepID=UPI002B1F02F1|nr:4Fe-4S binding protein [Acetobacterium wieringae]MEA4807618.1 4Fe-4S binding protein [Acetobacterium wieringae]